MGLNQSAPSVPVPVLASGDRLIRAEFDRDDIIRSSTFLGLWLAVTALLEGRMTDVLTTLQMGLASSAHQPFGQQLAQQG